VNKSSLGQSAENGIPAGRRHAKYPPALACSVLIIALASAGCASHAGSAGNSPSSGPVGTLRVTVIRSGGPPLPGAKTPTSPVANTEVKVTAAGSSSAAKTNNSGIATFRLAYGAYSVTVAACGSTTSQPVTVTAVAALTWTCPVP
jgi:hypothetical protein